MSHVLRLIASRFWYDEKPRSVTQFTHLGQLAALKGGRRRQAELNQAICEMFVAGASTTRVSEVVEALSGTQPSPSTVSRVFHDMEEEFEQWKKRPLQAHYWYVFADGTYFTVIYDGRGEKMPILAVIGIDAAGQREILGFTIGDHENQKAREDLLDNLKERSIRQIDICITDGG